MKNTITAIVSVCVLSFAQVERWVYQFDGGVNGNDEAKAIIQGTDGNIYTTGYGHILGNGDDVVVVSLTPAGGERWVYTYNGPGDLMDVALGVACDQNGNLYVAGSSYNNTAYLSLGCLTSAVVERWVYTYNGTGNGNDIANSIAVGLDGNVYAAGISYGAGTGNDFVIVSVDTAGNERWVYTYDWTGGGDGAYALVYGADHNLYAAGYSYHFVSWYVFTVVSIDSAGAERWIFRTQGTGVVDEAAYSIVYGLDGNLYAAGYSYLLDFTVVSLDTAGIERWKYWKEQAGLNDRALDVVYGTDGNIYSAGFLENNGTGYDFTVISLSNASDSNWIYQYNGSANGNDVANAVVYGEDAYIYAAGSTLDSITADDFTVIRLDATGSEKWVYRFNGSGDGSDIAFSITYGLDHNLYIAGLSYDSTTALDFTVISLDTTTSHIEEDKATPTRSNNFASTILSGPLLLPEGKNCKVFDITGRVVPERIKPGIYFIQVDGKITRKVIKVR